jgi:polyadenylate-binding protein
MGQPRMMGQMRFNQIGAPRPQMNFQVQGIRGQVPRPPMGMNRNVYAQPMGGIRPPVMTQPGVRPNFVQNSPYKFNQQVRNAPQFGINDLSNQFQNVNIQPNNQQQNQAQNSNNNNQVQNQQTQPPPELNAAMLAAAEPSQQKQMLGERIYPLVNDQTGAELAGKVTGMLLEIENFELLKLIDEPALLKDKVTEAMKVLKEHSDN